MEDDSKRSIVVLKEMIEAIRLDDLWKKIKIDPTNDAGKRANEYLIQANADLIRAQKNLERVMI